MAIELIIPVNNFDNDAHFAFEYLNWKKQPTRGEGYLFYAKDEAQFYIMKCCECIKSSYAVADSALTDRIYYGEQVVRNGDTVTVAGKAYTVKILGNYSDAGRLIPA
jgi:hypothetical protein